MLHYTLVNMYLIFLEKCDLGDGSDIVKVLFYKDSDYCYLRGIVWIVSNMYTTNIHINRFNST